MTELRNKLKLTDPTETDTTNLLSAIENILQLYNTFTVTENFCALYTLNTATKTQELLCLTLELKLRLK